MSDLIPWLFQGDKKPSDNKNFVELVPKSTVEDLDEIYPNFKPKEMISHLSPNTWIIRGEFGPKLSVCKIYNRELLSPFHRNCYLLNELEITDLILSEELIHQNLVNILKVIKNKRDILIFMEHYEKTSLDLVVKSGPQKEEMAKSISKQILLAIDYLHSKGISHRNIKLENIVLNVANEKFLAKLSDMTCALKCVKDSNILLDSSWVGTEEYMAPEILERKAHDPRISDIWSLGVTLFALLHNCFPFGSGNDIRSDSGRDRMLDKQLLRSYMNSESVVLSADCNYIFRYLMTPTFETRPDAKTVLSHKWFQTNH